jgi:hypothetical protein
MTNQKAVRRISGALNWPVTPAAMPSSKGLPNFMKA